MKVLQRSTRETFKPMLWTMLLLTPQVLGAQGAGHGGSNEWTNVGPQGGSFQLVTIDPQNPDVIYAATETGLFKSIDGAASWNNAGLNGLGVAGLVIDPQQPNILYAAVSTNRPNEAFSPPLFKSTDGGASWNQSGSGLPANFEPTGSGALAIDPHNTSSLYAFGAGLGSTGASLFKSTDAGASWSTVYQPPDGRDFYDIVFDPNTPGTVYAASIGADDVLNAVFKSVDGGTTWSEPDVGFTTVGNLTIDPSNPATLYTITSEGMYKTTDGAASWHALDGLPIQSLQMQSLETYADVVIDPHNPNTLYVVFDGSILGQPAALFKSTDAGASWHASGRIPGFQGAPRQLAIDRRNSSILYAATSNGIYRSIDGGLTFSPYSQARAIALSSVALDPQRSGAVLVGGSGISILSSGGIISPGATIFRSTDAGMSWAEPSTNLSSISVAALAIDPQNPNNVYAGTGEPNCYAANKGIYDSADGGLSWIDTQSGIGCLSAIVIDPQSTGTVYAGSWFNGGVNKSTDGGRTWTAMSSGLPPATNFGPWVNALAIDPRNTGTLLAGANGVFKSIDGGANWVAMNSPGIPGFPFPSVTALAVDPQTPSTVYAAIAPEDGADGLWKSVDGGANWRKVLPGNVYAMAIHPRNPATIYAGAQTGLARSTDGERAGL